MEGHLGVHWTLGQCNRLLGCSSVVAARPAALRGACSRDFAKSQSFRKRTSRLPVGSKLPEADTARPVKFRLLQLWRNGIGAHKLKLLCRSRVLLFGAALLLSGLACTAEQA